MLEGVVYRGARDARLTSLAFPFGKLQLHFNSLAERITGTICTWPSCLGYIPSVWLICFLLTVRQHGIPRYSSVKEKSQEARQQELRKIEKYRELDQLVHDKVIVLDCLRLRIN